MKSTPRILANHDIRNPNVRVVDGESNKVMAIAAAISLAKSQDLDLILINDKADPPICHITDLNKHRYELSLREKAAAKAKRENKISIKEVQFKPNIDIHDFETKCNKIAKFIDKGNIVKLQVQFKGRERQHTNLGFDIIDRVLETVENIEIDGKPQFSGNRITAVIKGSKSESK